jgi:hypothetical protein
VTEMRALVVDAPGAAAVRTLPVPEAGPGEVLVRRATSATRSFRGMSGPAAWPQSAQG